MYNFKNLQVPALMTTFPILQPLQSLLKISQKINANVKVVLISVKVNNAIYSCTLYYKFIILLGYKPLLL